MKLGLSSRVQMHTSDHVNLSNQLKVGPPGGARNYTDELAAVFPLGTWCMCRVRGSEARLCCALGDELSD